MSRHTAADSGGPTRGPAARGWGLGMPVGRRPRRPRYPCLRGAGPQLESLPQLLELLPPDFSYHVCSFELLPAGFATTLRVNFSTERGARDWLAAFQQSSLTTFRSRRTFPRPGPGLLYKAWFRCQRNVLGSAAAAGSGRNTSCPAALAITVCSPDVSRRVDPHLPSSPGCVRLKHAHNHPVRCAADLRFRGVSAAARGALEALMARGYPPAAARRALQHQLQLQLGENYPLAAADRAVIPSLKDVCRIYYQRYGTPKQRSLAAAGVKHLGMSGQEAVEEEAEGDGDADDPETTSESWRCLVRSESSVMKLGKQGERVASARLEMQLVDASSLMTTFANTGSVNSLSEEVTSDARAISCDPVLKHYDREGVHVESLSSGHAVFQTAEQERLGADHSQETDVIVERPDLAEPVLEPTDDAIFELELVDSEDVPVQSKHRQRQILNTAESSLEPLEPLPSLESLLAGRTVPDPDSTASRLDQLVSEYSAALADGGGSAAFRRLAGCGFAAALTSPLMRRTHLCLPQSGELVFVDSPGRSDRLGCCLWLLLCASEAGALPLGLLLASSDSADSLRAALELWRGTLPPGAFAGRGSEGPQVVVADDCAGQRAALAAQFPAALTVVCGFRLLQSVWRWLWRPRSRVAAADRTRLLLLTRRLLRAGSVTLLERRFREAAADPVMIRHTDFLKQFTSIYRHRHLWAVWYGEEEPSDACEGSARTSSLFDLAAGLLRDRFLFMAAEYGPAEAFDFWTRQGDRCFLQRINRALSGDSSPANHPRYVPPPPGADLRVRRSGQHEHQVTENDTPFHLDLELSCCTCRPGRAGAPCAHQTAAARLARRRPAAPLVGEPAARLRRLAARLPVLETGPEPLPPGWLRAVSAAAGVAGMELIVATEEGAEVDALLPMEVAGDSAAEDSDLLQMHDGDVSNGDLPEQLQIAVDVNNSATGEVDNNVGSVAILNVAEAEADPVLTGVNNTDIPSDPTEEAMSAAIVALQEVTADLTGRLAADPERYVPLVRDLVARYWRLEGDCGLRDVSRRLTELGGGTAEQVAERGLEEL